MELEEDLASLLIKALHHDDVLGHIHYWCEIKKNIIHPRLHMLKLSHFSCRTSRRFFHFDHWVLFFNEN
jgi:hypothetical protein